MKISLVLLTFNRAEFVEQSLQHNLSVAESAVDEIVWVDNGSSDRTRDVVMQVSPDVCVLHKQNLGVAKGLNHGFAIATGDYVLTIGPDMLMPAGWLTRMKSYISTIERTGVACWFHQDPRLKLAPAVEHGGLKYHPCNPWAANRIVSRELLFRRIGFLREDFGLYGWEDVEWAHRARRVCQELGLLTYAIAGPRAEHLGTPRRDPPDYRSFKIAEVSNVSKREHLLEVRKQNFPYFNPFC